MTSHPPHAADPAEPPVSADAAVCGGRRPASRLVVLTRRADFLRAASARRHGAPGFLLQARQRRPDEAGDTVRVGFTCSKKLGNAVVRNRAKRRLRAVARAVLTGLGRPGWDYVLVGRPNATVERPFDALLADLNTALGRIHDRVHDRVHGEGGPSQAVVAR